MKAWIIAKTDDGDEYLYIKVMDYQTMEVSVRVTDVAGFNIYKVKKHAMPEFVRKNSFDVYNVSIVTGGSKYTFRQKEKLNMEDGILKSVDEIRALPAIPAGMQKIDIIKKCYDVSQRKKS